MIELTEDQSLAVSSMLNHITLYTALREEAIRTNNRAMLEDLKKHQYFVLTGYAGTGKSATIKALHDELKKLSLSSGTGILDGSFKNINGVVTAFTGRACENLNERGVPCKTSHSLFYEPVVDHNGNLKYFRQRDKNEILDVVEDYVIIEEASMMELNIVQKVLDTGVAVIFVGDDAQLPPINGDSIFDVIGEREPYLSTAVMMLEDIKRTADGSSINLFADAMRRTGKFDFSVAGNDVSRIPKSQFNLKWLKQNWQDWDVVLCGTNKTRKKFNNLIRVAEGYSEEIPEVGERIICLKNTVIDNKKLNNGELYIVKSVFEGEKISSFQVQKTLGNGETKGDMITINVDNNMWHEETRLKENFGNQDLQDFTFGYAITVHKIQGSSLPNVIYYDENVSFFLDQQKFRYTAITRPSNGLTVVT